MTSLRIAVLDDYQRAASSLADWGGLDAEVTFFDEHLGDAAPQALSGFGAIVAMRERTPFPRAMFEALPELELLVTTGMRNASIDLEAAADHGVTVCGTRSPGHATAELAMALIQVLARGLVDEIASVRGGGWQAGLGRDLRGAVLGVIGLGRLGSQVAKIGRAFGMDVVAWSENLTEGAAKEVGVTAVSKAELLATADFVSIHLRLSPRTMGLIGEAELAMMRPDAYLINTSRGEIVDERALLDAVRSGVIAGAAVDVFGEEPLPANHAFRNEPRIVATPHIGYVTKETYEVFYPDAVEAIAAWQRGEPVRVLTTEG